MRHLGVQLQPEKLPASHAFHRGERALCSRGGACVRGNSRVNCVPNTFQRSSARLKRVQEHSSAVKIVFGTESIETTVAPYTQGSTAHRLHSTDSSLILRSLVFLQVKSKVCLHAHWGAQGGAHEAGREHSHAVTVTHPHLEWPRPPTPTER